MNDIFMNSHYIEEFLISAGLAGRLEPFQRLIDRVTYKIILLTCMIFSGTHITLKSSGTVGTDRPFRTISTTDRSCDT